MQAETARMMQELREAISASLGSHGLADAISALERSGHRVLVTVDATVDQSETVTKEESGVSFASDAFSLSPSDELFLRTMHITGHA